MTFNVNVCNSYNIIPSSWLAPLKTTPVFRGHQQQTEGVTDSFTISSELSPYLTKAAVQELMFINPTVEKILKANGLKA